MLYHSSSLEDCWEEETQEMRVYFMLTLLFGAMPEYSAVGEEGKIIFCSKENRVALPGKSPLRFENRRDGHP